MPFKSTHLHVARVDATTWRLRHALTYIGTDDTIVVPVGFVTDFASVPRSLQWLAPSTGTYTLAAIVHDWLCEHMRDGKAALPAPGCQLGDTWDRIVTSRDADGLFRRIMREQGVRPVQRWLLWAGARVGAIRNPHRRPGTLRDLPALAATAVVAAPFVLPVLVLIWIARLAYDIAEGLAGWFAEPFTTEETS